MKYYLGLDLGGTNMAAGLVDENCNIIVKESRPSNAGRTIEEVTLDMAKLSKSIIEKAGFSVSDISSWGIGMPSCINPKTNRIVHVNNFGWKNVEIFEHLEKHIDLPVYIENDANCAAYGEAIAGAAKDYHSTVMLTIGTGVGGGIIIDKRIFKGFDKMGVELGHTKLVFDGIRCTCGQKGCLESYASATALINQTKDGITVNPKSLMAQMCGNDLTKVNGALAFEAAKKGDDTALKIVDRYIEYLSGGISSFIAIFRPEVIIIGGGICNENEYLLEPLNKKIYKNTFAAEEIGVPKAIKAKLGNDAGIIGAALLEKNISLSADVHI